MVGEVDICGEKINPKNFRPIYPQSKTGTLEPFESHLLIINPDAGIYDTKEVVEKLEGLIKLNDAKTKLIIGGNETALEKYRKEALEKVMNYSDLREFFSFIFKSDKYDLHMMMDFHYYPKDFGTQTYREILERAILEDHAYKMVQNGKGWTFEQVRGEEYEKLAQTYEVIHSKLGKVNLEKIEA
jgi:hypothetical protein